MSFIKQCKGKDINKIPISRLENNFYASTKYDGHYVQICKFGDDIRFFTSGGKEFYHELAADELSINDSDFILEAEFIANTTGVLGSRGKAAKLTTYRTNYEKGLGNNTLDMLNDKFKVFDIIIPGMHFEERLTILEDLDFYNIVTPVHFSELLTLSECEILANSMVGLGFEGLFLKSPKHLYLEGKRVNNAIKLKPRPTADLICIDTIEGEGKYIGMIGSLVLRDSYGIEVKVGSGLSDSQRKLKPDYFKGKIIEIEYEQILDTYIQPTFIQIRDDKQESD